MFESCNVAASAPIILELSRRPTETMYAIPHVTEEGVVLDLEPSSEKVDGAAVTSHVGGALRAQTLVNSCVCSLQEVSQAPIQEQMQVVCNQLRAMLGYDRVMMYKFHEDQHGEVMAESFSLYAQETYKGLHFPSTDIPQTNRKIFMSMPSRMIADVAAEAVKIKQSARLTQDILLAASQLRGVSGCHGQYLSNMGVKGTLVLSVVLQDTRSGGGSASWRKGANTRMSSGDRPAKQRGMSRQKLWGLVVCHHYQGPRAVPYFQRSGAEFLVRLFGIQLARSLKIEQQNNERSLLQHQEIIYSSLKCIEDLGNAEGNIADILPSLLYRRGAMSMFRVTNATGAALVLDSQVTLFGQHPKERDVIKLVAWLQRTGSKLLPDDVEAGIAAHSSARRLVMGGMWYTHCLVDEGFPDAQELKDVASGVLAVDITPFVVNHYDGSGRSPGGGTSDAVRGSTAVKPSVLLWFRGEFLESRSWSGDKNEPQARHHGAEMRPRESFKAIKETLEFQSSPWQEIEKNSAAELQLLLRDTIGLHQSQTSMLTMSKLGNGGSTRAFTIVAEELRTIISTTDVPVMRTGADFVITEHNNQAGTLLLGGNRSAVGTTLMDFLEPSSVAIMQMVVQEIIVDYEDDVAKPIVIHFKAATHHGSSSDLTEYKQPAKGAAKGESNAVLMFLCLKRRLDGTLSGLILTGHYMNAHFAVMNSLSPRHDTEEGGRGRDAVANSSVALASINAEGRVVEWNAFMEYATGLSSAQAEGKLLIGELFGSTPVATSFQLLPTSMSFDPMPAMKAAMMSAMGGGAVSPPRTSFDRKPAESGESITRLRGISEPIPIRFTKASPPDKNIQAESYAMDVVLFFQPGSNGDGSCFMHLVNASMAKAVMNGMTVQVAAEAGAKAKARHIAFMSHEIRNPVNGILASIHAMDEEVSTIIDGLRAQLSAVQDVETGENIGEMIDLVKTSMACADQLRRTVDDILDMNKLTEGKLALQMVVFDLERMVRTVMTQIRSASQEKGLHLLSSISPVLQNLNLVGDVGRIQQILINFCWNAVKFTTKGSITIEVTCEVPDGGIELPPADATKEDEDAPRPMIKVFFKVIDTGQGMSQQMMETVFERFVMGDNKVGRYGGSGLGLNICRSLAELMDGEISCISKSGHGSTFIFETCMEIDSIKQSIDVGARSMRTKTDSNNTSLGALSEPDSSTGVEDPVVAANAAAAHEYVNVDLRNSSPVPNHPHVMAKAFGQEWGHNGMQGQRAPCKVRALREHIGDKSVAVLVEIDIGGIVQQHWGQSLVHSGNIGVAMSEAQRDAIERAKELFLGSQGFNRSDESGVHAGSDGNRSGNVTRPTGVTKPSDYSPRAAREPSSALEGGGIAPSPVTSAGGEPPPLTSVLIVDDDAVNRNLLARTFKKVGGIAVTLAEDGEDVIKLLVNNRKTYDVVMMDENMTRMNGSAAIREVRRDEAVEGRKPQFVIGTMGSSDEGDMAKYTTAGFNAVAVKPIAMKRIVECVTDLHRFWQLTMLSGKPWKASDGVEALPPGCPKPEVRKNSDDTYCAFFGQAEFLGNGVS